MRSRSSLTSCSMTRATTPARPSWALCGPPFGRRRSRCGLTCGHFTDALGRDRIRSSVSPTFRLFIPNLDCFFVLFYLLLFFIVAFCFVAIPVSSSLPRPRGWGFLVGCQEVSDSPTCRINKISSCRWVLGTKRTNDICLAISPRIVSIAVHPTHYTDHSTSFSILGILHICIMRDAASPQTPRLHTTLPDDNRYTRPLASPIGISPGHLPRSNLQTPRPPCWQSFFLRLPSPQR